MPFIKRLGYFLFGLSIGLVFLAFFFKKKTSETGTSFCYLPNCRVLKDMRRKPLLFSEQIDSLLAQKVLDSTQITYFFTEGDVDFSLSNTKTNPCKTYVIHGEINDKEATIEVSNCPSKLEVQSFRWKEEQGSSYGN
jgi:hypothetical protein